MPVGSAVVRDCGYTFSKQTPAVLRRKALGGLELVKDFENKIRKDYEYKQVENNCEIDICT